MRLSQLFRIGELVERLSALESLTAETFRVQQEALELLRTSNETIARYLTEMVHHSADLKIQGMVEDRLVINRILLEDILTFLQRSHSSAQISSVALETDHPVALFSDDHRFPRGTRNDNTRYPRFCRKCEEVFGRKVLRFLDLGCAGGGLVMDFHLRDHIAIGLEGSDYNLRNQRAFWRIIPNHLFICDITRPFHLKSAGNPLEFDVISAWEVLEHISAEDLPQFLASVREHLSIGGLFTASIATFEDSDPISGAVWHVTVRQQQWWQEQFEEAGFECVDGVFEPLDFPRGSGNGSNDWSVLTNPEMGFHLTVRRKTAMT
jgi:SAM-dependent methyltransferase